MNKQKTAPTFNLLDALIILALLAAAATGVYWFAAKASASAAPETHRVRYVVECKNIRDEFTGCVSVGDRVTESVRLYDLGVVTAYEYRDSIWRGTDIIEGVQVVSDYPGRSDMYITVEATAAIGAASYNIGGFEMSVGSPIYLRLPNFYALGYCISLEVID